MLKYAGVCVPIGETGEDERREYLQLARRASKRFWTEDMEFGRNGETYHLELRSHSGRIPNKLLELEQVER